MSRIAICLAALAAFIVSGCTTSQIESARDHCRRNTVGCVLIGAAVVGGVILIASEIDDNDQPPAVPSDARLKEHVVLVRELQSGVKVYAFNYKGDDRRFTGVLAQDVLAMPQFADAVVTSADGFYRVDYAKLGLKLFNGEIMRDAGEKAAKAAAGA